ncbi:MAG: FtsH protease activity modulator HflK [Candidatus Eisenbacteria bacterium]|nr:FtsH protease activity modulator HflK [Candidatus Eisenbacteria bacterium]
MASLDRVERTALVSVGINVGLVALKVLLATLSGSLALLADAWHSGSDIVASSVVWAGAHISRRENSRNLALIENAVALIVGGLILWAAVEIFQRVSAAAGAAITNLPVAIGGSLVAALVSYYAAQYKLHVGRETRSLSLIADGHHSRIDTWTTGAVVVGLMGHAIGIELDRIAAAVVALFIVESGLMIVLASVRGLREGTATRTASAAALSSWPPARVALSWLERAGMRRLGRNVVSSLRDPRRRRALAATGVLVLVALWLLTGLYFVGPGRVGVVRRWGRNVGEPTAPGVHLKAPWPVDRVTVVDVPLVRRVEIGFETRDEPRAVTEVAAEFYATLWESRHAAGTYEKRPEEALRLTGDENIVDMNAVVLYRVSRPLDYMFNVSDAGALVKLAGETVMGQVVGALALEDVLTAKRDSLEQVLTGGVQEMIDFADAGVEIVGVRLQDIHPPLEVVPSFRDVASAREDKNRIINEARAYKNQTLPKARGEAKRTVIEAEAYESERVDRAIGDSARFMALAAQYRRAREVTETRLYIEKMETLLRDLKKFVVTTDVDLRGYDIRMIDKSLGTAAEME